MTRRRVGSTMLVWAAAVALCPSTFCDLSPAQRRGKQIYLHGTSPSGGEITARMGGTKVEVPASVLPCVNCHGEDLRGRPEGGVIPTDITWPALTKPYGPSHIGGREHPPYTPPLLERAIATGTDPAGSRLHLAMPRYRLSRKDMEDLVAYLLSADRDLDPGVSADSLRIGTLLPPPGRGDTMGKAIGSILAAFFEEINSEGGIYGRRVDLRTFTLPDDLGARRVAVERFVEEEEVFALVGAFVGGSGAEIADLAQKRRIPLIGPHTLHPRVGAPVNRQVFYLFSGLAAQGRTLVEFATRRHGASKPVAVVVHPREPDYEHAGALVHGEADRAGWTGLERLSYPGEEFEAARLARRLADRDVGVVFFLDVGERQKALLAAAHELGWRPEVLVPGPLADGVLFDAPEEFRDRIFLAFPTLPGDRSRQGMEAYRRLVAARDLSPAMTAVQLATLASARVMVEGLRRAGRELSREKLVAALESLREFRTGLTPLISYGPNRRIGAKGGYVVSVDLERKTIVPASGWLPLR